MNNRYVQQFKKGSLEMILLCLIGRKETYGYEIISELNNSASVLGYAKEGTIYPILYRLQEAELNIKQVEKELSLPHKAKKEVVRDLNEVFASALEHGETEQQVIQRLGTPKEFADSTAEQFGIDNASSKKRKGIFSALVALIVAVVAFSIYAVTRLGKAPEGAIGQADATTNIQIESALGFDVLQIILAVGFAAAVIAVLLIIRTIHKNRR